MLRLCRWWKWGQTIGHFFVDVINDPFLGRSCFNVTQYEERVMSEILDSLHKYEKDNFQYFSKQASFAI